MAAEEWERAASIYKVFLEIAYISTGILCCAALAASPQMMELLYSEKYGGGLTVFCIYILVDLLRFTNITLILSAAGKTKALMFLSVGALAANAGLNVVLYQWIGLPGPAVATLLTTLGTGLLILYLGSKELETKLHCFFDVKYLLLFAVESLIMTLWLFRAQAWMAAKGIHYLVILVMICGVYGVVMLLLNGKRLLKALKNVNKATGKTQ